jgi:diguanylate cyclase (GGDEF)-like protein
MEVVHDGKSIRFTISLGISQAVDATNDYTSWLEQADQALYASKEGGRNQTNIFSHS